jgi:acyl carrier protein
MRQHLLAALRSARGDRAARLRFVASERRYPGGPRESRARNQTSKCNLALERHVPTAGTRMLNVQEIKSTVDNVILEVVKVSGASNQPAGNGFSIEPQMKLDKDFGLDSLDFVELVSMLETKFDIELSDDVFDAVDSVDDLYKYMSVTLTKKN